MAQQLIFKNDLKIIVIGTSDTGKTSFVNKWTKNIFSDIYKATIVSEFGFKIFEEDGKLYGIQLLDLAGQDKNAMVTKIFQKMPIVVLLCLSLQISKQEKSKKI